MSSTTTATVSLSFSSADLPSTSTASRHRSKSRRRLSKLQSGTHLSMASSSASLNHLSSELLSLVCEQLLNLDNRALWGLRRVSRRIGDIATPLAFRSLALNPSLVHEQGPVFFPTAFELLERYTRHVVVEGALNADLVRAFLRRTGKLDAVTWRFSTDDLEVESTWLPSDVLEIPRLKRNGTKLFVEELPMRRFSGDSYCRAVPADLLTSLKLARPTPPLTAHLASLKNLLIKARNLEVLHYQDRGQGTQFAFREGERLPPIKDLRLRSYDWDHPPEEVRRHWDFSQLETLSLDSVPCFGFLDSIDFGDFPRLRNLRMEDWSPHRPRGTEEATRLMGIWIRDHLKDLQTLEITCHTFMLPMEAILAHSDTLEVLHLRDHIGFRDDKDRCPMLDSTTLWNLSMRMKKLHTLIVDMDPRSCNRSEFLDAISNFPRLDTLTIHTQSFVGSSSFHPSRHTSMPDNDRATAMKYFETLTSKRTNDRPFNQITVNMGDWKPIMVRRLGATWRALNERGIFAERCFLMKRIDRGCETWEEQAVENLSPSATPMHVDYDEEED